MSTATPMPAGLNDAQRTALYKDCASCKNPVHKQSKTCKLCGAQSPWAAQAVNPVAAPEPAPPGATAAGNTTADLRGGQGDPPAPTEKSSTDKAPSKQPVSAPVDESKPAAPKVVHLAAASADLEPRVVVQHFTHQFGEVLGVFKAGDVITDYQTILKLEAAYQPIVRASEVAGVACCPGCGKVFKPTPMATPRRFAG